MRITVHRMKVSRPRGGRAFGRLGAVFMILTVVLSGLGVAPRAIASPGAGLRIVDAAGNTPVVNEGGRVALRVVDGSGNPVSVSSWSSDNKAVGKVKRTNGLLRGKKFGFATVTAQTSQGPVSGFIVCARLRRQNGAMTQGDTKTDTGGNVYLSHPVRHVLYKTTAVSADVFAGATGESGYQEGTGDGVRFNGPAGIGIDNRAEGGLYVADSANHCIRKIDFRRRSSLAAGTPAVDGTMFGDENPIDEAVFTNPRGVASVGANLYVTDTGNHCVWYVDVQRRRVQLVAGEPGNAGNTNGQGRTARFNNPSGITINTRGNLLAVADTGNNVVRLVAIAPRAGSEGGVIGQVTTLGLGSSARNARILEKLDSDRGTDEITFDAPISVSFDGVDNVYVIDNQTASVVTRPSAASGRPVERVDLAQVGTLGDPASVTVRRTQAFVLNEAPTSAASAVNVVEVGAPTIATVTPDIGRLEGGTQVTVTGTNFAPESKVTLGDAEVIDYTVESSTRITFKVPAQQAPGARTVTVLTRGGGAQSEFIIESRPLADLNDGEITTVAGGVQFLGDGGSATDPASLLSCTSISVNGRGDVFIADPAHHRVRRVDPLTGLMSTVAGTGRAGYDGDGRVATATSFTSPSMVTADGADNLFIADIGDNRIRRVDALTGNVSTVAGGGPDTFGGDGGPAVAASLYSPQGVAIDASGNVYIADTGNNRIRRVDVATGLIDTVVGTGVAGYSGDGGPASASRLNLPSAVAFDEALNLLIADGENHVIRRVDASTNVIDTIVGTGTAGSAGDGGPANRATLGTPSGIAVNGDGDVFIADSTGARIRRVDSRTQVISTVAGTGTNGYNGDGRPSISASVFNPLGVAVDGSANLYIADTYNYRVRRVDSPSGTITTVAGSGQQSFNGDNRPATSASLGIPVGVSIDLEGNLLVTDLQNGRIRRSDALTGLITTVVGHLNNPRDLEVDAAGNLFIVNQGSSQVLRLDKTSMQVRVVAGTGVAGYNGDNQAAVSAALRFPRGIALDAEGNLFIADTGNSRVRRVDAETGFIETIAGTGGFADTGDGGPALTASFVELADVEVDESGDIYVSDHQACRVRRIDAITGRIDTIAGTGENGFNGDGQPATLAKLGNPYGLLIDESGTLFVTEAGNQRVRRIDALTNAISTVAGTGQAGYSGDNGPAEAARLRSPSDLAVDEQGNLFIADTGNDSVRAIKAAAVQKSHHGSRQLG